MTGRLPRSKHQIRLAKTRPMRCVGAYAQTRLFMDYVLVPERDFSRESGASTAAFSARRAGIGARVAG